jgi:hypothetical protein
MEEQAAVKLEAAGVSETLAQTALQTGAGHLTSSAVQELNTGTACD